MPEKPLSDDALITMDFQDVDLSVVIKFMGELTGKNFLVSDQVRGKVTIISPKKVTVREAYHIFESVLEMNGYSALPAGESIKIIPSAVARQSGLEIQGGKEAGSVKPEDRMMTQVIPLEYAAADELRNLLASSVSKEGMIISYKATNHLIITDRAANIHRLLKIIEQLDVPMVEENITVFPLEFASAKSLADKLTLLMAAEQRVPAAAKPPGPAAFQRVVRVIPDERTNILIVLANAAGHAGDPQAHFPARHRGPQGQKPAPGDLPRARPGRGAGQGPEQHREREGEDPAETRPAGPGGGGRGGGHHRRQIHEFGGDHRFSPGIQGTGRSNPETRHDPVPGPGGSPDYRSLAWRRLCRSGWIGGSWISRSKGACGGSGGRDFGLISGVQSGALPSTTGDTGLLLGLAKGFITIGGVAGPQHRRACPGFSERHRRQRPVHAPPFDHGQREGEDHRRRQRPPAQERSHHSHWRRLRPRPPTSPSPAPLSTKTSASSWRSPPTSAKGPWSDWRSARK